MISKKHFNTYPSICYCMTPELIENYDLAIADKEKVWICHHRKEEFYTKKELVEMGMYFNVPPEDLVFCRNAKEHHKYPHKGDEIASEVHKGKPAWNRGKQHSEETKRKMSESGKGKHKGKPAWNRGKRTPDEVRKKLSESGKGKHKGQHWKLVDGKRVWY